jgi:cell fate (sporulation/competence/biofilm development) regulator YlbF (YheA/YmcA/DUF963 family)
MVNVYDYAHSLARALKESPEYRAYQSAHVKVKTKPSAEQMVKDFHKKQIELQSLALQGKEPTQAQKDALERLYGVISGDSDVREFLQAEQRLSVILNDVYKILGDALEIESPVGQ